MCYDKARIDWLEEMEGFALVSDDAGRWAVATTGTQNVPSPDKPIDISSIFWIEADEWKPSIREAIDDAMKKYKKYYD